MQYGNGVNYIGYDNFGPSMQEMQLLGLQQRAQYIQDMFGAKPLDMGAYRLKNNLKSDYGKASVYALTGGAIGSIALCYFLLPGMLMGLAMGALLGGAISLNKDTSRAMNAYASYLNDFAAQARTAHEKQKVQAPVIEQNTSKAPQKQWTSGVEADRSKPTTQSLP